jgi:hypothetical protein
MQYFIPACPRLLLAHLLYDIQKFSAQVIIAYPYAAGFDVYHNVQLIWNIAERPSKNLSKKTLDSIPNYSAADPSRYRQPQPRESYISCSNEQNKSP